jgi:hypothetical protein
MRQPETGAIFKSLIAADKNAQARPPSAVADSLPSAVAAPSPTLPNAIRFRPAPGVPQRHIKTYTRHTSAYNGHPAPPHPCMVATHTGRRGGPALLANRCPRDAQ